MFKNILGILICLSISLAYAGGESGGGGDATEVRVNEIRADILKWINDGGAKELKLSKQVSYDDYVARMSEILAPQRVIISFTSEEVLVNGTQKTCRSYVADKEYMLCNISRFKNTSESEQYKLIHHEYAGLALIEENIGASSDYSISGQITEYLKEERVLRLAVKNNERAYKYTYVSNLAKNTVFEVIQDIFVKAETENVLIDNPGSGLTCSLILDSSTENRIIRKGTTFTVDNVAVKNYLKGFLDVAIVRIFLTANNGKKASMMCLELELYFVEDLIDSISDHFSVKIPNPNPVDF
ncbi:MAG: hypothetical protein AB7I27_11775 [Bacteriovoracaceae bacterium]